MAGKAVNSTNIQFGAKRKLLATTAIVACLSTPALSQSTPPVEFTFENFGSNGVFFNGSSDIRVIGNITQDFNTSGPVIRIDSSEQTSVDLEIETRDAPVVLPENSLLSTLKRLAETDGDGSTVSKDDLAGFVPDERRDNERVVGAFSDPDVLAELVEEIEEASDGPITAESLARDAYFEGVEENLLRDAVGPIGLNPGFGGFPGSGFLTVADVLTRDDLGGARLTQAARDAFIGVLKNRLDQNEDAELLGRFGFSVEALPVVAFEQDQFISDLQDALASIPAENLELDPRSIGQLAQIFNESGGDALIRNSINFSGFGDGSDLLAVSDGQAEINNTGNSVDLNAPQHGGAPIMDMYGNYHVSLNTIEPVPQSGAHLVAVSGSNARITNAGTLRNVGGFDPNDGRVGGAPIPMVLAAGSAGATIENTGLIYSNYAGLAAISVSHADPNMMMKKDAASHHGGDDHKGQFHLWPSANNLASVTNSGAIINPGSPIFLTPNLGLASFEINSRFGGSRFGDEYMNSTPGILAASTHDAFVSNSGSIFNASFQGNGIDVLTGLGAYNPYPTYDSSPSSYDGNNWVSGGIWDADWVATPRDALRTPEIIRSFGPVLDLPIFEGGIATVNNSGTINSISGNGIFVGGTAKTEVTNDGTIFVGPNPFLFSALGAPLPPETPTQTMAQADVPNQVIGTVATQVIPKTKSGIQVQSLSNKDTTVTNNGFIAAIGADAFGDFNPEPRNGGINRNSGGITVTSLGGNVSVTNSGVEGDSEVSGIATIGNNLHGIRVVSGSEAVYSTGLFDLLGQAQSRIYQLQQERNSIENNNQPDASLSIEGIQPAHLTTQHMSSTDRLAEIDNQIKELEDQIAHIEGLAFGQSGGDVTVVNDDIIQSTGNFTNGIVVDNTHGNIAITNNGEIRSEGEYNIGISASLRPNQGPRFGPPGTIAILSAMQGPLSTPAMSPDSGHDYKIDIVNNGLVDVYGSSGAGISAYTENADINITNLGVISVGAPEVFGEAEQGISNGNVGIDAESEGGDVFVENKGSILVQGHRSEGIYAGSSLPYFFYYGLEGGMDTQPLSEQPASKIEVKNSGDIEVLGSDTAGIIVNSETSDVEVTNSGTIRTEGQAIVVDNYLTGPGSMQILDKDGNAPDLSRSVKIENQQGGEINIVAAPDERDQDDRLIGPGGLAVGPFDGAVVGLNDTGGDVEIKNAGKIDGLNKSGIIAFSSGNTKVENSGEIVGAGEPSAQEKRFLAEQEMYRQKAEENGKPVDTFAPPPRFAVGLAGQPMVFSEPVYVEDPDSGEMVVDYYRPVPVLSSRFDLYNSGKITGTHSGSTGVYATFAEGGTIKNSGEIIGGETAVKIDGVDGDVTIDNSGTLNGGQYAVKVSEEAGFLRNSFEDMFGNGNEKKDENQAEKPAPKMFTPTVDFTNSGKLIGDVALAGGDDKVTLNSGTSNFDIAQSNFDAGDGEDSLFFNGGGQTVDGNQFKAFEHGTLGQGAWGLANNLQFTDSFTLASGAFVSGQGATITSAKITIQNGSTFTGSASLNGDVHNKGSIFLLSPDTLTSTGTIDNKAGSNVTFTLGGAAGEVRSMLNAQGSILFADTSVISVNIEDVTRLKSGEEFLVAEAGVDMGSSTPAALDAAVLDDLSTTDDSEEVLVDDNSGFYDVKRKIDNNRLYLIAKARIADLVRSVDPTLSDQGEAVQNFAESAAGQQLLLQLNGLSDEQLVAAVKELTTSNIADDDVNEIYRITAIVGILRNRIQTRVGANAAIANAYQGDRPLTTVEEVVSSYGLQGIQGVQAFDSDRTTEAWAQAFWGRASVNNSTTLRRGTAVGVDFKTEDNVLLGASFSYTESDGSASNSTVDAETFGLVGYGAFTVGPEVLINATLGYFYSNNDTTRTALGTTYTGDYDSRSYVAGLAVSKSYEVESWTFTPTVSAQYVHSDFDSYTEVGAPAPLTFSRNDTDTLDLGIEASFSKLITADNGMVLTPEFHVGVTQQVLDADNISSFVFQPGAPALTSSSDIADFRFNVGGSLKTQFTETVTGEIAYEGTFGDDYTDHFAKGKISLKF